MISVNSIGSMLALGNKAGYITIWHVEGPETPRCVKSWKTTSDNWIARLSWSPWMIEGNCHISTLAYATADGVVQACKVKFNSKTPLEDIQVSENLMDFNQTLHPCTVLRWRPISTEVRNCCRNNCIWRSSYGLAPQLVSLGHRMFTNPTFLRSVKETGYMFGIPRRTGFVYGEGRLQKLSQISLGIPLETHSLCSSWTESTALYV